MNTPLCNRVYKTDPPAHIITLYRDWCGMRLIIERPFKIALLFIKCLEDAYGRYKVLATTSL